MNMKGVSPIIATLLLIVIAVAGAVVTYAFVTNFIGSSLPTGTTQFETIGIDAVNYSNGTLYIAVRNTDNKAVHVDSLYIENQAGGLFSGPYSLNTDIPTNTPHLFTVATSSPLPVDSYLVKVVCTHGGNAIRILVVSQ